MATWLEKQRDKARREKLSRELTHKTFTPPDNPIGDYLAPRLRDPLGTIAGEVEKYRTMPVGEMAAEFGSSGGKLAGLAATFAGKGAKTANLVKSLPAKTEFELAHEVAQRNAALPVEQGGLGLPPNNTAMDRAKAMGFDTPAYHGSLNANQSEFIPSKGGELGKGTYITDDPSLASEFARTAYGAPFTESSGVYPLFTKELQEIPRNNWVEQRGEVMDSLRAANNGEWEGRFYNQAMDDMRRATESDGKHGWYTPGVGGINQGVVFNPKNIRSRFAAFDPMQRNSANILAGGAAGAIGLSSLADLLNQQEYQ